MKVYTHASPQVVLVVTDDLAVFEYVHPGKTVQQTVRTARATIKRASPECYVRTHSLDDPQEITPKKPPPAP